MRSLTFTVKTQFCKMNKKLGKIHNFHVYKENKREISNKWNYGKIANKTKNIAK